MKRPRSETDKSESFKKTKHNDTSIGDLAKELQKEIFARVARDSCADIARCKLSCKLFKDIAEDEYIYRHVSLDEIPITSMFPDENRESFLEQCKQSQNPEAMFRQAVVDYFSNGNTLSACQYLDRAVSLGHKGAVYLLCIVDMYSGNKELKESAIKKLGGMRKSNYGRREVRNIQMTLKNHLRIIGLNNKSLEARPICSKAMEENHRKKLSLRVEDYEDSLECEACLVDFELQCYSKEFGY